MSVEDKPTIRENSAIYAIITAFPFVADAGFMPGFEAGMLWRALWTGQEIIQESVAEELEEGIKEMAAVRGYECECRKSELHGYIDVTLKNVERRDPTLVAEFIVDKIEKL